MRIQHNIMAMNAYRNYNTNNSALSKNLEKLSSGYAINRAGDDAAGLAISEKMRAQITGLSTAQDNAQSGINLVQTAEGAMTEVHDMLNRMYELANQSANGTYDEIDREQLNKEVDALKEEINRIADSTNFNGIQLLDGNLSEAKGVELNVNIADSVAGMSPTLGSFGSQNNGVLSEPKEEVNFSANVYFGEITNNNAANKNITIGYKDNTGADQTITLTLKAGQTATAADVISAITTGTGDGVKFDTTVTDSGAGNAFDGSGTKAGEFTDLYDVTQSGDNMFTITAKDSGTANKIDGSKLGIPTTVVDISALDQADKDAAQKKLVDSGLTDVNFGQSGDVTVHQAAKDGKYELASTEFTIADTVEKMHNAAITVGDMTYIIKSADKDLSDNTPAEDGTTIKYIELDSTATADDIAKALASTITATEQANGGFVATYNSAGKLTISESPNRGLDIYGGNGDPTKIADVVKLQTYTLSPSETQINGSITFDASSITNGTTVTIGDKTYLLTDDASVTKEGTTQVLFTKGASDVDTGANIVDALKTAIGSDVSNLTASGNVLTFTDSTFSAGTQNKTITTNGTGLTLQIGDTNDVYNKLNVTVQDMHTDTLGIDEIDISDQKGAAAATDLIKSAINTVSDVRGTLGAAQNRLEHTINSLSVTEENITSSESSIRDTDVAEEMMAYTKNNILIQSAQAMLAQANQVPQGVLQLLG